MVKPEHFHKADDQEKEDMIRHFLPLVKRVVHRVAGRLPPGIDIKEMLNSGIIGLVDALEKYDSKHEANFATYAQFRIRGAILDSFRSQDWVPRSLRHKAHQLENTFSRLEQKLGRPAEDQEVAEELNVDLKTLQKMLKEVSSIVLLSFEELGFGHGEDRYVPDALMSEKKEGLIEEVLESEKVGIIARALDRLPAKERLVITLYFYEELNLKEIGDVLGVTESRASQIRSRALLRLRPYLAKSL